MVKARLGDIGLQGRPVPVRAAKEKSVITRKRGARSVRRHAPVDNPVVVDEFIGQEQAGIRAQPGGKSRIDGKPVAAELVAVIVQRFGERIDPDGRGRTSRPVVINRARYLSKRIGTHGQAGNIGTGIGPLGRPVHNPAAAAAAEDHRIRSAQDLDLLDIIQRPEILHIVTQAIDEEVCRRILATYRDLVAVAFALADRRAGRITQDIAHIGEGLLGNLVARHHGQALRHVDNRRLRLGAAEFLIGKVGAKDRNRVHHPGFVYLLATVVCEGRKGCEGRQGQGTGSEETHETTSLVIENELHARSCHG